MKQDRDVGIVLTGGREESLQYSSLGTLLNIT